MWNTAACRQKLGLLCRPLLAVTDGLARRAASSAPCYRLIQTLTVIKLINCMDKLVGRMSIVASIVNLLQQTTVYCITVSVKLCSHVPWRNFISPELVVIIIEKCAVMSTCSDWTLETGSMNYRYAIFAV